MKQKLHNETTREIKPEKITENKHKQDRRRQQEYAARRKDRHEAKERKLNHEEKSDSGRTREIKPEKVTENKQTREARYKLRDLGSMKRITARTERKK